MAKYRAAMFMAGLAIVFVVAHFYAGWEAAIDEAATHQEAAVFGDYVVEWVRDTAENLQSEFWQLAVQFALLAGLFEFMRVHAYEEDEEDVKQRLQRIEALLHDGVAARR
jgi:hypothetical protein